MVVQVIVGNITGNICNFVILQTLQKLQTLQTRKNIVIMEIMSLKLLVILIKHYCPDILPQPKTLVFAKVEEECGH